MAPDEIMSILARLGHGDATAGFRSLCVSAHICSNCGQKWDANDDCACTRGRSDA